MDFKSKLNNILLGNILGYLEKFIVYPILKITSIIKN